MQRFWANRESYNMTVKMIDWWDEDDGLWMEEKADLRALMALDVLARSSPASSRAFYAFFSSVPNFLRTFKPARLLALEYLKMWHFLGLTEADRDPFAIYMEEVCATAEVEAYVEVDAETLKRWESCEYD